MANKSVWESFAHAFEGLSHVMWTQRHVRVQLIMVVMVLMLSYYSHIEWMSVLFVMSAITLVLLAEFFNTAIEVVVNMITEVYHPLAKIAKDVAAAGVLIASTYALVVGSIVFLRIDQIAARTHALTPIVRLLEPGHVPPVGVLLMAILVLSIIVALSKIRIGHGTILRGGAVSGHSAVAFLLFAFICIYSGFNPYISAFAFILAFLVAQSRVEGKIHTLREVIWGACVAIFFVLMLILLAGRPQKPIDTPVNPTPATQSAPATEQPAVTPELPAATPDIPATGN